MFVYVFAFFYFLFFFFKQKTAYEMRISDWSSDVCSSDLVIMHAPKNGFFYVIDRATGKLISAEKLGKVTWAKGIDMKTGRPIEVNGARYEDGEALIWPGSAGLPNWPPMSYSPNTGLVSKDGRASGRGRGCQYG